MRARPSLGAVLETVADSLGCDASQWQAGRRFDDTGRALAAYLARRHFRYRASEVAAALGYRSHGGVHNAVRRVEASDRLTRAAEKLARKLA